MSTINDIVVLCNNRMAFPAIQALYALGRLHTIGVPIENEDVKAFCIHFASQTGINLIWIEKSKLKNQLEEIIKISNPKYIFTMTFPWKISEEIIKQHSNLFYNFHYGLLPEMRGADPVFESIKKQKKETGISVHSIDKEIDKGKIILKKTFPLHADLTHGMVCTNLSYLASHILPELLTVLHLNDEGITQDETKAQYYKKPTITDVSIQWENQDSKSIQALVNACNPWNKGAYTQWNGLNVRIVEVSQIDSSGINSKTPGTILEINENNGLIIQCYDNTQLRINTVYTDEGFMSGHKLLAFGIKNGEQFASL
ncbi:formyltransferase family protein [Flavobacterium chilense]|uniref:Methionyl-tRNA formyltransferase n=1 Tax=Flavobacterium chilense TaxID=946677 RepID=A0A1M7HLG0_9FLAO|nr:formyltransferase family protein [Flavobacterium chilense]SHM29294.1 methionyl-tRNA formyltransferase [Flavobacterium chilense]